MLLIRPNTCREKVAGLDTEDESSTDVENFLFNVGLLVKDGKRMDSGTFQ
jgi:hypothetical protein